MPADSDLPAALAETESELHLADLLQMLRRHWRLIAATVVLALLVAVTRHMLTPIQYQATTMLQINPRSSGAVTIENMIVNSPNREYDETQFRLLQSRGLAERVIRNLNLAADPEFNPDRAALLPRSAAETAAPAAQDEMALAALAKQLLAQVEVRPLPETRLVEVSFRARTPELAGRVVNGLADAFIQWSIEKHYASVDEASSYLDSQIEGLKQMLADRESQLQEYNKKAGLPNSEADAKAAMERLSVLNRDYVEALSDRIRKEYRHRDLKSTAPENLPQLFQDPSIAGLRTEISRLELDYAAQLKIYKPEWPAVQALKKQIDQKQAQLDEALRGIVAASQAELQTALRREQVLKEELDRLNAEVLRLNSSGAEYSQLKLEISTWRTLLDDLMRKRSETEVAIRLQGARESNVHIVERGLPGVAYRPSLRRNLLSALALGLVLGICCAFLAEYLDRTIKLPEDVEKTLGIPVLAVIPDASSNRKGYGYGYGYGYGPGRRGGRKRARKEPADLAAMPQSKIELYPHLRPRTAISEAYRSLRTALLLSTAGELESISVTSSMPNEGKTTTAVNLAVVMAQLGRRVLLVDGDLRKPRVHTVFGASNRTGLVNFLTTGSEWSQVVLATQVPNLDIVPCGPIPPNPSELLSSERMQEFLRHARQEYSFLIIDTPPVLPVTDAIVVGAMCSGVVLCLQSGYVPREDAISCRERLRRAEVKLLGAVLNGFLPGRGAFSRTYHPYEEYLATEDDKASEAVA